MRWEDLVVGGDTRSDSSFLKVLYLRCFPFSNWRCSRTGLASLAACQSVCWLPAHFRGWNFFWLKAADELKSMLISLSASVFCERAAVTAALGFLMRVPSGLV